MQSDSYQQLYHGRQEKMSILFLFFNNLIMRQCKRRYTFLSFFSSLSSRLCTQPLLLHHHLLLLLLFFLFYSLAALGCSPVSLKPISSITEIIFLPGYVFVQREWISQLSEAVENRGQWLWVAAVCAGVCACVCAFSLCALCSLAAHGCFLINASLSWRSYCIKREAGTGWKSYVLTSVCHLRAVQSQGFG